MAVASQMVAAAPVRTEVRRERLVEVTCPVCLPKMRRVLVRAAGGSVVEAYCRHCKYRKVVRV